MIDAGELSERALDKVSGGMKTDPNHQSSDIIDARGGYSNVYGVVTTYDVNGNVSSLGGVQIPPPK
jgi:hypothetical protein